LLLLQRPPGSNLFPYTTLFRSQGIWLFAAENLSASPRLLRAGTGPVLDVAFSPAPGAEVMLSAHDDGAIRLWDVTLGGQIAVMRSEEHTSELQSRENLVCRLLL